MDLDKNFKNLLAPIVALSAVIGFAIFVVHMINITTKDENQWNRTLYLFSGVEAIAFAATGFFFGSEVQRQTVEKAEGKIQELQDEASKGKALAAAVKSLPLSTSKATPSGLSDEKTNSISQDQIQYIKDLAENIYNPLTNPNL